MNRFSGGIIVITIILFFSGGCYYDNEEVLYPAGICDTADVKYSNQVGSIISNNCLDCHSNSTAPITGSNVSFEGYTNLSTYIWANQVTFRNSINHVIGYNPMPKDRPKMNDCNIRTLEIWADNGCPNN